MHTHRTTVGGIAGSSHPPPTGWVLATGFALTLVAGGINAVGFLGVQHQALTHLTGTITQFSLQTARGSAGPAMEALGIIGAFFAGSVMSGLIVRKSSLRVGRRYGVALMLEAALLVGAVWLLRRGSTQGGDQLASLACGLQNGLATSYAGAVIRTTHMTGIVTDLGLACAHRLRGDRRESTRLRLHAALLAGFVLGGVAGTLGFARLGMDALLVPAMIVGLGGLAYWLWKHTQRNVAAA
ncbi:MAG: YoaK family protein [Verrucomicrobiota bacterium]